MSNAYDWGDSIWAFRIFRGENSFVETLQILTLGYCLIINFKLRNKLLKVSNLFTYYLRLFFIIFFLYEELSFLTEGRVKFFSYINNQSQINLHNSYFLDQPIFTLIIHPFDSQVTLYLYYLILGVGLFLISFGSYISLFDKVRYFFLEKKYSLYLCFYFLNIIISSIIRRTLNPSFGFLMHEEFSELFVYIVFLLDTLQKKYNLKKR